MISVVIPLYNKAPYIERAIRSILCQTSRFAEIIVVDDGSTDAGPELVQSLNNSQIRLVRQKNQGVSVARNRGIAEAKSALIALLDADDAWEPRFLEVILKLRKKYPRAGAYATAYRVVTPDAQDYMPEFNLAFPDGNDGCIENYFQAALTFPVWSSAVAVPKKVFEEIGGFQYREIMGEDADTWLRIALRYPIAWSSERLAIYYQNATNRAMGFQRWSTEPKISFTARKAIQEGLVPPEKINDLREYAAFFQLGGARDCLLLGAKETARQLLAYARGTRKFAKEWWTWRLLAALPGNPAPWLWKMKRGLKRWVG